MKPEREKRATALTQSQRNSEKLASVVEAADDKVFADFCRRIKVANIREYEDVQLKAAQEEEEAIEAFNTQKSRVKHQ